MAEGEKTARWRPGATSTRRACQSRPWTTSAARAWTSTSAKSRVPVPAQADRLRPWLLPLSSTVPNGSTARWRVPALVAVHVVATRCSAKPNISRPAAREASNSPPRSRAVPASRSGEASPGSSAKSAETGPAGSGAASSAASARAAAAAASATRRSTSSVPATWRVSPPYARPCSRSRTTTTPTDVVDVVPVVVSWLAAQRRLVASLRRTTTTTSSAPWRAPAASAASTSRSTRAPSARSCGPSGTVVVALRVAHAPPSCSVLRTFTCETTTAGQPWLTGAACPGWPLPQLSAPCSDQVDGPPSAVSRDQKSGVLAW